MLATLSRSPLRRSRSRMLLVLLASMAQLAVAPAALAGTIGNGGVLIVGYSGDQDASGEAQDLLLASLGWRWRWDGADVLDDFFAKVHTDFSWAVEPLVGGVFADARAFEASVVPYAHFSPLGWDRFVPWFEGGIGLAYTSLHGYGLGSRVEFSDNAGIGVTFGSGERLRWSIGYRFRHLSHLGLFGDRNEGLNAHFLTLTVE